VSDEHQAASPAVAESHSPFYITPITHDNTGAQEKEAEDVYDEVTTNPTDTDCYYVDTAV